VAAPFEELYDLENNPQETVNLAEKPEYRRRRDALHRYSQVWRNALSSWKSDAPWSDPVSEDDLRRDGLA
jgi:hypothetical protein